MSFLNLSLHAAGGRMNGPLLDSNSLLSENARSPMVSTSVDMTASSLIVKSAGIKPGGYPIGLFPAPGDTSIGLVIVGDCCSTAAPAAAVVRFGFTGVCACGPPVIAPSLVSLRMRLRSARSSGVSSLCLCLCFLCAWASSGSVDSSPSRLTPPPRSEGPSLNFTLSAGAAPSGAGDPARGVPPGVLSRLDRFPLGTLAPMMAPASPPPPPAPVAAAALSSGLGTAYIVAHRSASRRSHSACNRASSCACSTFFRYSSSAAPVSQPSTTSPSSSSSTSRSAAAFCFSSWSSSHAFSSMSTTASASIPTSSRIRTVSSR
mmetsp:Transcript_2278/g.9750  ORF Transcript_2278/g.9750 Transcript_2278/m.9750 type:complete len:318 (+) Transcript_2278:396-1349(+)